jgi:hypothetical protein
MTQTQAPADDRKKSKSPEPAGAASKLSLSDLYIQAYTNMRATDEISLKLCVRRIGEPLHCSQAN